MIYSHCAPCRRIAFVALLVTLCMVSLTHADTYVITRDTDLRSLGLVGSQRLTIVTPETDLRQREIARWNRRLEAQEYDAALRRMDAQIEAAGLEVGYWERQVAEFYRFNRHFIDGVPFFGYEQTSRLELGLARIRLSELERERRLFQDQRPFRKLRDL